MNIIVRITNCFSFDKLIAIARTCSVEVKIALSHLYSGETDPMILTNFAGTTAAQVRGFSRAEFKGFGSISEAQAYLQGGTALHSLHPSSRPQTKRKHAAGPAWQGALLQEYSLSQPAQLPYQYSTAAVAFSSGREPSNKSEEEQPHCPDCMLCHPGHLYRLVSNASHSPGQYPQAILILS